MANNELSGPLVTAFIYDQLKDQQLRYSYRFIFVPETIGSICYLSLYGKEMKSRTRAGFVVTTIGDAGPFTYKRSPAKTNLLDRAVETVLRQTEKDFIVEDFFPMGSDERQYCSPGFNLPVGSLMRTRYGKYSEYHTSADNKDFISFSAMEKSVQKYLEVIHLLENNFTYVNQSPYGEPQLGKRGLYPTLGSVRKQQEEVEAMMWILNMANGTNDLIDIIDRSGANYRVMIEAASKLEKHGLIIK